MTASGNLEGHGRPNVFLAGQVGQKYKDLDSGLEWVCTGERGFIKVDGDDQSEMYNWELVESSGSTGGGVFDVTAIRGESGLTTDKSYSEILEAHNKGCVVRFIVDSTYLNLITFRGGYAQFTGILYNNSGSICTMCYARINSDNTVETVSKRITLVLQ